MNDKFESIDINNGKVKSIIDAAFEEFAKYGESKASLNKILKSAGISKGVFYHYFSDKEELFNFLMYYSIELSIKDFDKKIDWDNDDIIKRIANVSKLKFEVMKKHPYLIEFGDKFKDEFVNRMDLTYQNNWRVKFYKDNIDFDKLKDPTSAKEVLHIVRWSFKGLFMNMLDGTTKVTELDFNSLIKQCDTLYEVLSNNFYK